MILRQLRPVGERVPLPALRDVLAAGRRPATARQLQANMPCSVDARREFMWLDSGTAALAVAMRAAADASGIARPEVIIPAFACPAIVAAAVHAGVQPVLVDFHANSAQLDPRDVCAAMSERTVAIIVVRLLGLPGNCAAIRAVVGRDCPIIEDCAHVVPHEALPSEADAAVLSFGRGKPVSLRQGGLLIMERGSLLQMHCTVAPQYSAGRIDAVRHALQAALYNQGSRPFAYWFLTRVLGVAVDAIDFQPLREVRGFPGYLTQALNVALENSRRTSSDLVKTYSQMLRSRCGPWTDIAATASCSTDSGNAPAATLWRYPLLLSTSLQRDQLFEKLWCGGLGASRLYRRTLAQMPTTAVHVRERVHPHARSVAGRLLTLPLHSDVTTKDVEHIRSCLDAFAADIGSDVAPGLQPMRM